MKRPCRRCGTAIGRLVETCPSCGEYNKADVPLYVWAIGGLIVLGLMLLLGDPGAIVQMLGRLLHQEAATVHPAP
ncbi:MAG TPA: hypothetical protein VF213_10260 [Dongiaceae bacterium]